VHSTGVFTVPSLSDFCARRTYIAVDYFVCPSQADVLLKRPNTSPRNYHRMVAEEL